MDRRRLEIIENPQVRDGKMIIERALSKSKVIIIIGRCEIDYQGRASSRLEFGDRIIIIKEDKALLVHRSTGYKPVNWMPGGDIAYHVLSKKNKERDIYNPRDPTTPIVTNYSTEKRGLKIRALRKKPRETIDIYFDALYLILIPSLVDIVDFDLHASEREMQKAIILQPSLIEQGLRLVAYEKKVEPGFIDVYCTDRSGRLVVIEIKRRTAGKDAVLQLARYLESMRTKGYEDIRGILVAPRIAKGVQPLLTTMKLEFKALNPKRCARIIRKRKTKKIFDYF